eukprot:jgi/Botrbrau1/14120/Bobra.182_3s0063.1
MGSKGLQWRGSQLLGMAIKAGLPDLSNYLLRVGSKGQMSAGWVVWVSQAVEQVCGTSVLHLAVQSAEPVMLDTVISWAKQNAFCWKADWQGDRGVSPLHLAVFLPDGGRTALKLAETCSPGPEAWFNTAADDGMTPAGFTSQLGMHHLNIKMTKLTSLIRSVSVHDRAEGQVVPVETCFCGEFREQSAAGSGGKRPVSQLISRGQTFFICRNVSSFYEKRFLEWNYGFAMFLE